MGVLQHQHFGLVGSWPHQFAQASGLRALAAPAGLAAGGGQMVQARMVACVTAFGPDDAAQLIHSFARRQAALPTERPSALTKQFSEDPAKLRRWQDFLNKNRMEAASLGDTVVLLDDLLWPPTQVAAACRQATATWRPEAMSWV